MMQPTLKPGYAFQSTKRRPKAPDTVVVGTVESAAKFVGTARIDGACHNAFRLGRTYFFQLEMHGR